jgi:hypothetical protein
MSFPLSTAARYEGFTHRSRPKRPHAPEPDARLAAMGRLLAAQGRGEDDLVAHINRREARLLAALGGAGTRNARTGLLEFDDTGDADTPEEEGTPAPVPPPENAPPISPDVLAQADANLRAINPAAMTRPGPSGLAERAKALRQDFEDYISGSAVGLSQIPGDLAHIASDFKANPSATLDALGPTLDGIAPGLESFPRAAATAMRSLRLIGLVPDPDRWYPADYGPQAPTDDPYHYAFSQNLPSILETGLRKDSYAATEGDLTPMQAQIDLALPPNHGLRDSVLRIDLAGLRRAGEPIPVVRRVARDHNMPGGGYELFFPAGVKPQYLSIVPKK